VSTKRAIVASELQVSELVEEAEQGVQTVEGYDEIASSYY